MPIFLRVTGIKETIKRLDEWQGAMEQELRDLIQQACAIVEAEAKKRCPVLTGYLRRSIHSRIVRITKDMIRGRVIAGADYAYDVEFGSEKAWSAKVRLNSTWRDKTGKVLGRKGQRITRNFKRKIAKPYLYPAMEAKYDEVKQFIADGLRAIVQKYGQAS